MSKLNESLIDAAEALVAAYYAEKVSEQLIEFFMEIVEKVEPSLKSDILARLQHKGLLRAEWQVGTVLKSKDPEAARVLDRVNKTITILGVWWDGYITTPFDPQWPNQYWSFASAHAHLTPTLRVV